MDNSENYLPDPSNHLVFLFSLGHFHVRSILHSEGEHIRGTKCAPGDWSLKTVFRVVVAYEQSINKIHLLKQMYEK